MLTAEPSLVSIERPEGETVIFKDADAKLFRLTRHWCNHISIKVRFTENELNDKKIAPVLYRSYRPGGGLFCYIPGPAGRAITSRAFSPPPRFCARALWGIIPCPSPRLWALALNFARQTFAAQKLKTLAFVRKP